MNCELAKGFEREQYALIEMGVDFMIQSTSGMIRFVYDGRGYAIKRHEKDGAGCYAMWGPGGLICRRASLTLLLNKLLECRQVRWEV
jgi:hypothetical protein